MADVLAWLTFILFVAGMGAVIVAWTMWQAVIEANEADTTEDDDGDISSDAVD